MTSKNSSRSNFGGTGLPSASAARYASHACWRGGQAGGLGAERHVRDRRLPAPSAVADSDPGPGHGADAGGGPGAEQQAAPAQPTRACG